MGKQEGFRREKHSPGQTNEVVRNMTYLQVSEPDLTRAEEYWLGKMGSGFVKPRKSSRRILSHCDWTSFPSPSPNRRGITRIWTSVMT